MFNFIYVILSKVYRKAGIVFWVLKISYKFLKNIFNKNHINIPVLLKFQLHTHWHTHIKKQSFSYYWTITVMIYLQN